MPPSFLCRRVHWLILGPIVFLLVAMLMACSATQREEVTVSPSASAQEGTRTDGARSKHPPRALDLSTVTDLEQILPNLVSHRVVFVGEAHNRYGDHINQLKVIRLMYQKHPTLAIGVEYFQQPFQAHLDAYIAGKIDEKAFLRQTEYYKRWQFDYRLYRPIFEFARENKIPVVALNVPKEVTAKVARSGLEGLDEEERTAVPKDIDRSDTAYRARLRKIYEQHPHRPGSDFERFYEAQLLWDEGMAARAADYLSDHPDHKMVVLAGSGHIAYGSGIPNRLERRIKADTVIVLNDLETGLDPNIADYILVSDQIVLPSTGKLGIYMDDAEKGVIVRKFSEDSAAKAHGVRTGDQIVSINGEAIQNSSDVRIALLDKQPGDSVSLFVRRASKQTALEFEVRLR